MKVVICPDSFKESMSSIEAADAIERGVLKADKNIKTVKIPLADGGEGTSTVLNGIYKGIKVTLRAHDAYMRLIDTYYYRKDNTAIIELAAVCGLEMIEKDLKRCEELSELIPEAMIINGDGTDKDLLMEEGITEAESFASLTGIDEQNVLLSLYADSKMNGKIITKVN